MPENPNSDTPAQRFRDLMSQRTVIGTFSKSQDPAFIEIIGHAGFDFVVLDMEHGPNTISTIANLIRAAEVSNLFPIVRVKEDSPSLISGVLDLGAGGVQVPQIDSKEGAEATLRTAKFNPLGMRGVCRFVRAADYSSMDRYEYFESANTSIVVMQLEGQTAVDNIESILSVPGLDIAFIGPYDLSQSLGVAGKVNDPQVSRAMKSIVDGCMKRNVKVGTFVDTMDDAQKWIALGVKYICFSVDVGIFTEKCHDIAVSLMNLIH